MKDLTIELDDERYEWALKIAEERGVSVEHLICDILCELTSEIECGPQESKPESAMDEEGHAARRKRLQKLWDMADARDQPGPAETRRRNDFDDERKS